MRWKRIPTRTFNVEREDPTGSRHVAIDLTDTVVIVIRGGPLESAPGSHEPAPADRPVESDEEPTWEDAEWR